MKIDFGATSLWNNNYYGHYDPYGWYEETMPQSTSFKSTTGAKDKPEFTNVILVAGLVPVGLELLQAVSIQYSDSLTSSEWNTSKLLSFGSSAVKAAGIFAYQYAKIDLMAFPVAAVMNLVNLYYEI